MIELRARHPSTLEHARSLFIQLLESVETFAPEPPSPDRMRSRGFDGTIWWRGDRIESAVHQFSWSLPAGIWRVAGSDGIEIAGAVAVAYERRSGLVATLIVREAQGDLETTHAAVAAELGAGSAARATTVDGAPALSSSADSDYPKTATVTTWRRGDAEFALITRADRGVPGADQIAAAVVAGMDIDTRLAGENWDSRRYTNHRAGIAIDVPSPFVVDAQRSLAQPEGFVKAFRAGPRWLQLSATTSPELRFDPEGAVILYAQRLPGATLLETRKRTTADRPAYHARSRVRGYDLTVAGFIIGDILVIIEVMGDPDFAEQILASVDLLP
jgi:hypothetical protein